MLYDRFLAWMGGGDKKFAIHCDKWVDLIVDRLRGTSATFILNLTYHAHFPFLLDWPLQSTFTYFFTAVKERKTLYKQAYCGVIAGSEFN